MAELLYKPTESAFIEHLVEPEPLREEADDFGAQEQSFDGDVAIGNVTGYNQKTEAIDAPLESAVGLFTRHHAVTVAQLAGAR